jgi:branched-chain amino acid transport system ATP-binding protein
MQSDSAIIAASGICKRFGALVSLDHIDFAIQSGEAVGIVGPNGAGKTTLLNVLAGAMPPSAGTIFVRGSDVTSFGAARRSRLGISRSHQIPRPFGGMTVFENVFVASTASGGLKGREAYDNCIDALDRCGMLALANRPAQNLGLLDRKRLELARALATNPMILLLDEIGGGLTDEEATELVRIIKGLHGRKITIVWIEHIVHVLLQVIERLVCMDAGRIIAEGKPQAVLENPVVIQAYLGGAVA